MSQTASTLLLRNLHGVFGEIDPVRRRAAIEQIFHEDAVFYEPNGAYRGRDEIDRSTTSSSRPVASVSAGSAPRGCPHTMPPGSRTKPPSSVTARIGFVEVTPGRALVPGRHGRADRRLVRFADATAAVAQTLLSAMRPGVRISELQAKGRDIYRREGVPDPAAAVIFFHGLGLSHMDIEQRTADGKPNGDWVLEGGMVVPVHLLYPGGEHSLWQRLLCDPSTCSCRASDREINQDSLAKHSPSG